MLILHEEFKYRRRRFSPIVSITDVAYYEVGWIFTLRPFFMIIKVKISKVMDAPKYVTIIEICGRTYSRA